MEQQELFEVIPRHKLASLSKEELLEFFDVQQNAQLKVIEAFRKDNARLRALNDELEQKHLFVDEQYITLKNKIFGKSSEKAPSQEDRNKAKTGNGGKGKKKVQLPSLRYPDSPLIEREVEFAKQPDCNLCGKMMSDSGMTENAEFVTVVPTQFIVIRQKRHKSRCGKCHGSVKTAPAPPRIRPGSSYSDEMIVDVALSKYCDLIPIERYAAIAGREGMSDIPPQSLIQLTHYLAEFLSPIYNKIKNEVLSARVLHADETPHRMLEGGGGKSWYLWGFSSPIGSSYFETHDTRSGDVASELLVNSRCEYLMSDVFSGYRKAVRETNKVKMALGQLLIKNIYCNAHSRRKFKDSQKFPVEADQYVQLYQKIYRLEKIAQKRPSHRILRVRRLMKPIFESMKKAAIEQIGNHSSKSSISKAMSYFLKNYTELTLFIENADLPIDNNLQERQLRNPVVGRKTWYGTHSEKGAKTAAVLFSIVESCKLSGVNPRVYFKKIIQDIHKGIDPQTPKQFIDLPV